jgi:transposase
MQNSITIAGLDVSKEWVAAATLPPGSDRPTETVKFTNDAVNVSRFVRRVAQKGPVAFVYEAGPCGYELHRQITAMGYPCAVIAPALTPIRPGDRIKTDRRDAEKLAHLYRSGELTEIRVPTCEEEAARDLVRARESALEDRLSHYHRLLKFLLRQGRVYRDGKSGSKAQRAWLRSQRFDHTSSRLTYEAYVRAWDEAEARLEVLNQQVTDLAAGRRFATGVSYLRCLKGLDTLSAVTLLTEVVDFRRFQKARAVMGYTGMVPSEYTTNFDPRRGRITKTGNAHLRRILVEAAWTYRRKSVLSKKITDRRKDCPPEVVRIAKKAEDRLHRKFWRLLQKGLPQNKIAVAVARELAGFAWAIAQHVPVPVEA